MDYDKLIPQKIREIQPSGIRKFFDIAQRVEGVISLSVGEPDFKTPWAARKEAINILEKGKTAYTANSGLMELRKTVCNYLKDFIHTEYDPNSEVIITVGGSEAIDLAIRAMIEPGDEVLVPEPSFVCYSPITAMM
ncbi:MAG: aminotransferase class I/II-fold pyridoxal phosphate-dependent enzyme, partial [Ruminococcaceae bacterium]|nr:aminotransferase class I/II-fold pyridoxal phosphate-dependent enzyme [Oscillospiraceae bacterium]